MIAKEEYEKRITALQLSMTGKGLDALIVYSWKRGNLRFLTGYHPNYIANVGMLFLPAKGSPSMYIRFPFDLGRARQESAVEDITASGDIETMASEVIGKIRDQNLQKAVIGIAGGDPLMDEIPASLASVIRDAFPDALFKDARDLLIEARLVKSPSEAQSLTESAHITDEALKAASKHLRPGAADFTVIAEAEKAARIMGAEYSLFVISTDGTRERIAPPKGRFIEDNSVVILEGAVDFGGYWTQAAATFTTGVPGEKQLELCRLTFKAYTEGIRYARPGATVGSITGKIDSVLAGRGWEKYAESDYGHGIGMDLPEPPQIRKGSSAGIIEGMALVIHPSVQVPGEIGSFLGGTVIIGEKETVPLHSVTGECR